MSVAGLLIAGVTFANCVFLVVRPAITIVVQGGCAVARARICRALTVAPSPIRACLRSAFADSDVRGRPTRLGVPGEARTVVVGGSVAVRVVTLGGAAVRQGCLDAASAPHAVFT